MIEASRDRFNAKSNETAPHPVPICYRPGMEERIIKLETLSAMQDETVETLNKELYRQQQEIARLLRRIETLEKRFAQLGEAGESGGNEKPPHY